MEELILAFVLLLAVVAIVWVTVLAVRSVHRGEKPWKAFKTWLVRVIDVLSGVG